MIQINSVLKMLDCKEGPAALTPTVSKCFNYITKQTKPEAGHTRSVITDSFN